MGAPRLSRIIGGKIMGRFNQGKTLLGGRNKGVSVSVVDYYNILFGLCGIVCAGMFWFSVIGVLL